MLELNGNEIEILRAVSQGCDTSQKIRPLTKYASHDSVRNRCKRLTDLGLLETWLDKVKPQRGAPKWGSHANQRYYKITTKGADLVADNPAKAQ